MNHYKAIRLWLGLTVPEMAKKIGVRAATLYAYENGTRSPSLDSLMKMSKATGLTIDQIIHFSLEPSKKGGIER